MKQGSAHTSQGEIIIIIETCLFGLGKIQQCKKTCFDNRTKILDSMSFAALQKSDYENYVPWMMVHPMILTTPCLLSNLGR
jgi:hypothetical protein